MESSNIKLSTLELLGKTLEEVMDIASQHGDKLYFKDKEGKVWVLEKLGDKIVIDRVAEAEFFSSTPES